MCREFSYNQENNPYVNKVSVTGSSGNETADIHKAKWSALFNQMEKALSEEEKQLVSMLFGGGIAFVKFLEKMT